MRMRPVAVTIDCEEPGRLAGWWAAALEAEVTEDFAVVDSRPVELGFQRVADDRRAVVERLVGMGATEAGEHSAPGFVWSVLRDPEGR
ncbi:VOC family protein [Nocardiopsis halophila]|uniref:VOC family protein n=1 Tax=Nocardiopsis halophila TaxID=141692 RepID=UPI000347A580|nr:VOC family protein [Nocardiopsis halophila]